MTPLLRWNGRTAGLDVARYSAGGAGKAASRLWLRPWWLGCVALLLGCSDSIGPGEPVVVAERVVGAIHHSCGISADGELYCWGRMVTAPPQPPTLLGGAPAFHVVTGGVGTTCGLTEDGRAYCWGMNNNGQIGDGTTEPRMEPTPVAGDLGFVSLATGILHSCGVAVDGTAYCWGWNSQGQLGDGTMENRSLPTPVAGGLTFASIDTYSTTTCGLTTDGATYCWGFNAGGQVGDGTTTEPRLVPTRVAGEVSFAQLAIGGSSCALTAAGEPYCWGAGYGATPTAVPDAPAMTMLSAGGGHACGLTAAGEAYCWGWNAHGQLGDGTTDDRASPTRVAGGLAMRDISASGWLHTCGVTVGGEAYCWGNNDDGQLGDGTTTTRLVPTPTLRWGEWELQELALGR